MDNASSVSNSYLPPVTSTSRESSGSAVSWAAVIAGAVIAAAVSLMLLAGGVGLGFASASPWSGQGASATTIGISAIVWMIVTQIIAYGLGGYLAGRLRTKWVDVHTDEVYFRDTAHGFLVWALSAVVSAVVLGSALASVASGTAKAGATVAAGAGTAAVAAVGSQIGDMTNSSGYLVDSLFRSDQPSPSGDPRASRAEVGRIISASVANGDISPDDKTYVAKVVAAQTGIDQPTAEARVTDIVNRSKQAVADAKQKATDAADKARKAAAAFALWGFASLLIGAFIASWMATIGGRTRDSFH